MQSLMLGLLAALCWGFHDFTLRRISGRADPFAMLLIVLILGAALLAPFTLAFGHWASLGPTETRLALLAGIAFAFACYGHYRAFAIGPVRLVAPICGAYPLLAVGFVAARGGAVPLVAVLGAVAVLAGIALVARGETEEVAGDKRRAVLWSCLACLGFASTFGLMQWAVETGGFLQVSLVTRLACFAAVLFVVRLRRVPLAPALALWPTLLLMAALDLTAITAVAVAGGFAQPEFASIASSIFGLVTILLAWRLLGEALKPVQWLGAVIVFAGIASLGLV